MSSSARSTFATLLKQSKFSSFDPLISQVYTTHGGDAHRGHWGFKRPIPLRRRGAYITVRDVDTPECQTDWNSAEPQALWMKNWDELKLTPKKRFFAADEHNVDSDHVPQSQDSQDWRQPYIPNLETMSRSEFAQLLREIRAYRRTFLKHRAAGDDTSYQLSNKNSPSTPWYDLVASQLSQHRRSNPRSREIEHLPHSSGGLSYAQYSPLQTFLMTKERKGRLANDYRTKDQNVVGYVASFAGMAGRVQRKHAGLVRPVVWDDPNKTGEAMIRPQAVEVTSWPMVVGKRQGLKAARVNIQLRVWDQHSHHRSNPHPLGSSDYIAAAPPPTVEELTSQMMMKNAGARKLARSSQNRSMLSLLKSAMPAP